MAITLTHFGHSCVLLEEDGTRILIDPGTYSAGWQDLTDLDAIFVTHQHPDHLDVDGFPGLRSKNSDAVLYCDPMTADREGGDWQAFRPGDSTQIGALTVSAEGGEHAIIHPAIPTIDNVALLIGTAANPAALLHPGDSLHTPATQVDTLLLPTSAPWLKAWEAVDYLRAIAPRVVVPIHEKTLSSTVTMFGMFDKLKPEQTTLTIPDGQNPIKL